MLDGRDERQPLEHHSCEGLHHLGDLGNIGDGKVASGDVDIPC